MEEIKVCRVCGVGQPIENFQKHNGAKDGRKNECRECCRKYNRAREIKHGHLPYQKVKSCSWYLGVHVAKRLLEIAFNKVVKMPLANPHYDFICGRGLKVDVKSSCTLWNHSYNPCRYPHWLFTIRRNTVADYFACIAIDNRTDLNPLHFWLIPGYVINDRVGLSITASRLDVWKQYEKPLDKIIYGCNLLKGVA